jgi:integrase
MTAMKTDLPHLSRDRDRHGNERIYVRKNGKRIRIRIQEGTAEFAAAYSAALGRILPGFTAAGPGLAPHAKGTLGWLGARYFASKDFAGLAKKSQSARRSCLEQCFRDPMSDEDPDPMGNCPLRYLSAQKIRRLIEIRSDQPGAAANRKKHLSALCGWGVDHDHLPANPARDVKAGRKIKGGGFHTWTVEEVQIFEARHPVGSKARLAMALLLFTGSRRQDMVTFGKQHVRDGILRYVPQKTLYKRRDISQKPWLPVLAEIVEASPCGSMTFLVTHRGQPYTAAGFGNWFREKCDEAGLHHCSAHGLKKAGATIAAENGATTMQLMAIFDWSTVSQAEVYTRSADRKRMAAEGMDKINLGQKANG